MTDAKKVAKTIDEEPLHEGENEHQEVEEGLNNEDACRKLKDLNFNGTRFPFFERYRKV